MALLSSPAVAPVASTVVARPAASTRTVVLVIALLILGTYLRFANLADNPGWDGDEGYNWSIASNLAAGHGQMFALRYAFVQHPPLFYVLGAALLRTWTHDLLALRALSALCGVLTIPALLGLGTTLGGKQLGIATAVFYAIWPQAVLQTRWAYTYNLLALLVVLALWAGVAALPLRHAPRSAATLGPVLLSGILAGLALATDQEALPLLLALGYLWLRQSVRAVVAGLCMAAVPVVIYLGWMFVSRGSDLLFDIQHSASRLDSEPATLIVRAIHLTQFDPLIALGLFGLPLLPRGHARTGVLILTLSLGLLILMVRDPSPYFRAAEPLLPISALGIGTLLWRIIGIFRGVLVVTTPDQTRHSRHTARLWLATALLLVPIGGALLAQDVAAVRNGFSTSLTPILPHSSSAARQMAAWMNAHTRQDDTVIVMPATAWLFRAHTADLLQAVAIDGHGTSFYPDGLARARFVYDTHLVAARYLVVDDFTRLWIAQMPRERALVEAAQRSWSIVYHQGEYAIYANSGHLNTRPTR